MKTTAMTASAILFGCLLYTTAASADCRETCDTTYEECKAEHDSPNGEKVCGSDYQDCKRACAEEGN